MKACKTGMCDAQRQLIRITIQNTRELCEKGFACKKSGINTIRSYVYAPVTSALLVEFNYGPFFIIFYCMYRRI